MSFRTCFRNLPRVIGWLFTGDCLAIDFVNQSLPTLALPELGRECATLFPRLGEGWDGERFEKRPRI